MESRCLEVKIVIKTIIELRQYISIVHHVKGRIRLRIASTLIKKFSHVSVLELNSFICPVLAIEGVKEIQVVLIARSAVIHYDPYLISPDLWKVVLTGDEEEVAKIVQTLRIPGMIQDEM